MNVYQEIYLIKGGLNEEYKYEITLKLTTYLRRNDTAIINKPNYFKH